MPLDGFIKVAATDEIRCSPPHLNSANTHKQRENKKDTHTHHIDLTTNLTMLILVWEKSHSLQASVGTQ